MVDDFHGDVLLHSTVVVIESDINEEVVFGFAAWVDSLSRKL